MYNGYKIAKINIVKRLKGNMNKASYKGTTLFGFLAQEGPESIMMEKQEARQHEQENGYSHLLW